MYSVEYAKSGRSKCKQCKGKIDSGALRLGVERDLGDYSQTAWHHPACLPASNALRTLAVRKLPGFKELQKKDQTVLRKLIAELGEEKEGANTQPAKRSKSRKGKKTVEFSWKGYTAAQYADFKSQLESLSSLSNEELKQICRKNDQKTTGTKAELMDRAADGRVLGRIPKCGACGGGRLRFNPKSGAYACPGYMEDDTFVHCSKVFAMEEVVRLPWSE